MKTILFTLAFLVGCAPLADGVGVDQLSVVCEGEIWQNHCIDPTGVEDFSEALQQVIDTKPLWAGAANSNPQIIDLPEGAVLRLAERVVIDRPVHLRGHGSRIKVDDGITGLYLTSPAPNGGGADYSVLEGLWIVGSSKTNGSTAIDIRRHGIRINGAACLSMETCFNVRGQYGEDGGNANAQRFTNLVARSCGTAINISGGDAQVGLIQGVEILGCHNGVVDSSAFGNVFVGVSTEGMTGQGFLMDKDSGYSTVVGGYQESGEASAHIRGRSALVVGGNLPLYLDDESQTNRVGYQSAYLNFKYQGGPTVSLPGIENGDVMSWNWQSGVTSNGYTVSEAANYRLTWDEQLSGWSFWHLGPRAGYPQYIWHGTRSMTLVGAGSTEYVQGTLVHDNVAE